MITRQSDEEVLKYLLDKLIEDFGDTIAIVQPGSSIEPPWPALVVLVDRVGRPDAFDPTVLRQLLSDASAFANEGRPIDFGPDDDDVPDEPWERRTYVWRIRRTASELLAKKTGRQPLRPTSGPSVLLISAIEEADPWIDLWEGCGIVVRTGRDLVRDFKDAAAAAKRQGITFDEALGRFGWTRDPGDMS